METERIDAAPAPEDRADLDPAERGDSPIEAAALTGITVTPGLRPLAAPEHREAVARERRAEARPARREPRPPASGSGLGDRLFDTVTAAFAGLILVILAGLLLILVLQAREAIQHFGLGFLTGQTWDVNTNLFGAAPHRGHALHLAPGAAPRYSGRAHGFHVSHRDGAAEYSCVAGLRRRAAGSGTEYCLRSLGADRSGAAGA